MPIGPDVLATALNELMPKYSELFTSWHPILDKIVLKSNFTKGALQGPRREFTVVTDGPGNLDEISTGNELITGGRRQNAVRGNVIAPRLIYSFDVPAKDLAEANGAQDLARVLRDYPELALSDFHERMANQLANGNGNGMGGFVTLNGDMTYNPQLDGARSGIFDFSSVATQASSANVVHGLAKTTTGWQNQYANVTSFAVDGRRAMRQVYFAASRAGSKAAGDVDLILADEESYLNYLEDLDDQVRVAKIEGDKAPGKIRVGTKFFAADILLEDALDPTLANFGTDQGVTAVTPAGAGRSGVMYFLKTSSWYMYTLGHDSDKETKGFFDTRGPFRIPDQDAYRYEIVLYMGIHTNQLRCNGCLDGSSIP